MRTQQWKTEISGLFRDFYETMHGKGVSLSEIAHVFGTLDENEPWDHQALMDTVAAELDA